jgi:hypothetical protein
MVALWRPGLIETAEGQRFYHWIRLYRPLHVDETRRYIEKLRSIPLQPVGA